MSYILSFILHMPNLFIHIMSYTYLLQYIYALLSEYFVSYLFFIFSCIVLILSYLNPMYLFSFFPYLSLIYLV